MNLSPVCLSLVQEQLDLNAWWKQCTTAAQQSGGRPITVSRQNGKRKWRNPDRGERDRSSVTRPIPMRCEPAHEDSGDSTDNWMRTVCSRRALETCGGMMNRAQTIQAMQEEVLKNTVNQRRYDAALHMYQCPILITTGRKLDPTGRTHALLDLMSDSLVPVQMSSASRRFLRLSETMQNGLAQSCNVRLYCKPFHYVT
ncbi:hypothetical protein [Pseudomonas phage PIP]|nr:hypothetical protein [Pseudomonas phage PIP]